MTHLVQRFLIVLIAVCCSNAAAFSSYFGLRGEAFVPPCNLCGGVQFGVDFDTASGGPGVRVSYTTFAFVLVNRVGLDAYWRAPLEGTQASAYLGVGGAWGFGLVFKDLLELHALLGVEWRLSSAVGLFLEGTLGSVLSGSQNLVGPPPPPDFVPSVYVGSLTASVGIGFNFRL